MHYYVLLCIIYDIIYNNIDEQQLYGLNKRQPTTQKGLYIVRVFVCHIYTILHMIYIISYAVSSRDLRCRLLFGV